jgi:hypothetical protein
MHLMTLTVNICAGDSRDLGEEIGAPDVFGTRECSIECHGVTRIEAELTRGDRLCLEQQLILLLEAGFELLRQMRGVR